MDGFTFACKSDEINEFIAKPSPRLSLREGPKPDAAIQREYFLKTSNKCPLLA